MISKNSAFLMPIVILCTGLSWLFFDLSKPDALVAGGGFLFLSGILLGETSAIKEGFYLATFIKLSEWSYAYFDTVMINSLSMVLFLLCIVTGIAWIIFSRERRQKVRDAQAYQLPLSEIEATRPYNVFVRLAGESFPILIFFFLMRSFILEPCIVPTGSMEPTIQIGDCLLVKKYAYGLKEPLLHYPFPGFKQTQPKRGDVIVFRAPLDPKKLYIKRVVGLPGDRVQYRDRALSIFSGGDRSAAVPISHEMLTSETDLLDLPARVTHLETIDGASHTIHSMPAVEDDTLRYYRPRLADVPGVWVVPEGCYFAMGDNRNNSDDSRYWGMVSEAALVGKAWRVFWSWDSESGSLWSRVRWGRIFKSIE